MPEMSESPMKDEFERLRQDVKTLTALLTTFITDMPDKYVPRREYDKVEARLFALEEFKGFILAEVSRTESRLKELILTTVAQAVKEGLQGQLNQQKDQNEQRTGLVQWLISNSIPILFFVMTLLINLLMRPK